MTWLLYVNTMSRFMICKWVSIKITTENIILSSCNSQKEAIRRMKNEYKWRGWVAKCRYKPKQVRQLSRWNRLPEPWWLRPSRLLYRRQQWGCGSFLTMQSHFLLLDHASINIKPESNIIVMYCTIASDIQDLHLRFDTFYCKSGHLYYGELFKTSYCIYL